jgi:hypothetical protein
MNTLEDTLVLEIVKPHRRCRVAPMENLVVAELPQFPRSNQPSLHEERKVVDCPCMHQSIPEIE